MKKSALAQEAKISLHLQGKRNFPKVSYPVHSGIYSEIETDSHVFHFNRFAINLIVRLQLSQQQLDD